LVDDFGVLAYQYERRYALRETPAGLLLDRCGRARRRILAPSGGRGQLGRQGQLGAGIVTWATGRGSSGHTPAGRCMR
jgi:hypothetical protein